MKLNELIKNYKVKAKYGVISHTEEIDDLTSKCLCILGIILNKKVDVYTEFVLNDPKDYEDYCLYHNYKYNTKTLLTVFEFTIIKEALNDLI